MELCGLLFGGVVGVWYEETVVGVVAVAVAVVVAIGVVIGPDVVILEGRVAGGVWVVLLELEVVSVCFVVGE